MSIVDTAIKRPVTVWMATFAIVLFGLVGLSRLAVNLLPELSYPTLTVRTTYTGAAPSEIEQLISKPIEEAVGVVKGLRKISSISKPGQSDVLLEFEWDVAMDITSLEVREKLDLISLPLDVEKPLILKFNPSLDPIIRLGLQPVNAVSTDNDAGIRTLTAMRTYGEYDVKRQLESIAGVASVKLGGGLEQEYQVIIDQHKLAQLNLNSQQISQLINRENINISAGKLIEGNTQYLVRTLNQFNNIKQIGDLVVYQKNDQIIYLKNIATIKDSYKERTDITRINAKEAVELAIYKEGDANTVEVASRIKNQLERNKKNGDNRYELTLVYDQSTFISNAISEVKSAAIIGGLLAMLVLYLFLRSIIPTLIISLSIPVSVIATFNLMYANDITLNIMSLGGIALATGLLVDNAIVALENIARYKEQGLSNKQAAAKGTKEVSGAIIASTLTTLAVFIPLIFVEGVAGQLFHDQALTVTFALIASLLVALTLIPMLASRDKSAPNDEDMTPVSSISQNLFSKKSLTEKIVYVLTWPLRLIFILIPMALTRIFLLMFHAISKVLGLVLNPITAIFNKSFDAISHFFTHFLKVALAHPLKTLIITLGLASTSLLIVPRIGVELLPPLAQGEFYLELELSPGTPLVKTDEAINEISTLLRDDKRVKSTYSLSGSGSLMTSSASKGGEHQARLQIIVTDQIHEQAIMNKTREIARKVVGATNEINRPALFTLSKPMSIELASYSLDSLDIYSKKLATLMNDSLAFDDVVNSMRRGQPELSIIFDHQRIAHLGLNSADISELISVKVGGNVASQFTLFDRKIDILVRSHLSQRNSINDLRELIVNPNDMHPISLASIATIKETVGPAQINRINQQRVAVISANIAVGDQQTAIANANQMIEQLNLPLNITSNFGGQSEEMAQSFNSMMMALALAVFLVYLVMASQFESLLHPLLILFSVPLAGVGSLLGLYITGTNVSVIVFLGLIMLSGIVVNNAIVLVDRINQLRLEGIEKSAAIIQAAQSRLRPIIMTTLTTILGLLPMCIGLGEGSELRAPMAITVISGLIVSTILTLIVIPVLYRLFDNKKFINDEKNAENTPVTEDA